MLGKKKRQQQEVESVIEEAATEREQEKPDLNEEYLTLARDYQRVHNEIMNNVMRVKAARKLNDRESLDTYKAHLKELKEPLAVLRKKLGIGDPAEICVSWDDNGIYTENARAKDFVLANYYLNGKIEPEVWEDGIFLGPGETECEVRDPYEVREKYIQRRYKQVLHNAKGVCRGKFYEQRIGYRHPLDMRSPDEFFEDKGIKYRWEASDSFKNIPLERAIEYVHKLQDCSDKVRVKIQGKRS